MKPTFTLIKKHIAFRLSHSCVFLAIIFVTSSAFAGSDTKQPDPKAATLEQIHPMYLGSLNTGIKGNDAYVDGNFSLVAPIWSTLGADSTLSGGLLFLEPYISWGEGGEVATSLGLGYRYLFGEQSINALTNHDGHQAGFFEEGISIGGSLFLDMLDTEANNQFWQLGVGLEVATRYVEVSGNYYIPLSEKELAEETRTTETFSTSTTSQRQSVTPLNSPYTQGNSIAQDALFTTTATTTTRTTTIERLFQRFEEGMEGWDAQIAVLVPWVDRYMDVKIIGGYYSFDNQPFGPQEGGANNVEGWKAGLEVRPVPALVLTGTWYEDERLTGGDWTVGVQMQIPFEGGELGDGKGFWGRIKDSFKPRRRHLIERLAEPVHRQNAAVKIANSVKTQARSSTNVQRSTRVVSRSASHIVLADDVVFVNNGDPINGIQTGSASGTGSAEQPLDTIQAGSILAQTNSNVTGRVWSVYTQGTVAGYTGDVSANFGSVNFIGSGNIVSGISGTSFGSGPAPSLVGGIVANSIGTFGITSYTIIGGLNSGSGDGIRAFNVDTVNIRSNTVSNAGNESIVVRNNGSHVSNAVIANNSTSGGITNGIRLRSEDASTLTATLTGNTIDSAGSSGVKAHSLGTSTLNLTATGNNLTSPFDEGFELLTDDTSTLNATLTNNTIANVGCCAVNALSRDGSFLNLTATGNTISTPGSSGFVLESKASAKLNATLNSNIISTPGIMGIEAYAGGSDSILNLTASNNTIVAPGLVGIFALSDQGGSFILTATGNTIDSPGDDGIVLLSYNTSVLTATLTGNTVTGAGNNGFDIESDNKSTLNLTATNNTIITPVGNGIGMASFTKNSKLSATLNGNTIMDAGADGILAQKFFNLSTLSINGIVSNTVTGSSGFTFESILNPTGIFKLNDVPVSSSTTVP